MPPRLFIEPGWLDADGHRVRLPRDRARYLRAVLRLGAGAPVTLFDGSGREYAAVLEADGERDATAEIVRAEPAREAAAARVVLAAGLTKGSTLDLVIQKATELGAAAVHPLLTHRAVPRPGNGGEGRLVRWRRIAMEAAEQCGRVDVPAVHPVERLDAFLARPFPGSLRLCLHEGAAHGEPAVAPLREVLAAWLGAGAPPAAPPSVVALVGPEGGLAPDEASAARAAGFAWAGLGPRVLRAETAALATLAVLAYELDR